MDKEKREGLHYRQLLEETKTPLLEANREIEGQKKDLIAAHRHELLIVKEKEKVEREKEVQIKQTQKAEQRTKEQTDLYMVHSLTHSLTHLLTHSLTHHSGARENRRAVVAGSVGLKERDPTATKSHIFFGERS